MFIGQKTCIMRASEEIVTKIFSLYVSLKSKASCSTEKSMRFFSALDTFCIEELR